MSVKAAGVGHFQIPTAPAALTAVAQSATANTLGSAVSFGNAPSALYITGVHIGVATTQVPTYVQIQILVAASIVTSVIVPYGVSAAAAASVLTGFRPISPPIPVANAAAITVKSASSVASAVAWGVSLECIAQSNVVDDGITVGTVNLVNTLTTYTGNTVQTGDSFARLGAPAGASHSADVAAVKVDTAANKVKTDFLPSVLAGAAGGLFIAGSNAATTVNFTGNLSGSVGSVTGAVGSVTGAVGSVTGAVGSVTGSVGGNVVGSVASVTARVTANTDQLAGQTVTAAAGVTFPTSVASPTNITAGTITTATNLTNNNDKIGYALTTLESMSSHSGTAQAGAAASITLAVGASATDSLYVGSAIKIYGGTGAGQTRVISAYVGATKVATVARNWTTAPDGTSTYSVLALAVPKVNDSLEVTAAAVNGNVTGSVASVTGAVGSVTGNVGGNVVGTVGSVVGAVGSVAGAVGSVTGNVGGNVVGTVASVVGAVGSVTGLTASRLDVAVSTLATAANLALVAAKTDLIPAAPASTGDVTTVGTAVAAVKSDTAAVKAKTDSLGFTVAGMVDANIKAVADDPIIGAGIAGVDEWRPGP